jgi:hypothetical protein
MDTLVSEVVVSFVATVTVGSVTSCKVGATVPAPSEPQAVRSAAQLSAAARHQVNGISPRPI